MAAFPASFFLGCNIKVVPVMKVPDVLLSGNHKDIAEWRSEQQLKRTAERRKDLFEQ